MTNIIIEKLEEEIVRLLEELGNLEPESDEYNNIMNRVVKLYDTLNKEKELIVSNRKVEVEADKVEYDKLAKDADTKLQKEQLEDSKLWSAAKVAVEVSGIIVPVVFYGVWMHKGLKFEETGTITSGVFKGLIGKFKPTK